VLNNWCSSVRKAAHAVVAKFFDTKSKMFHHAELHAAFVSDSLEQMCFVYKHPDNTISAAFYILL